MSRQPRQPKLPNNSPLAFTVDQFCFQHNISRPYFYKMQKVGIGPRIMKIGTRTLVSVEAARDWRRERENPGQDAA
jgi:hypothetical protein